MCRSLLWCGSRTCTDLRSHSQTDLNHQQPIKSSVCSSDHVNKPSWRIKAVLSLWKQSVRVSAGGPEAVSGSLDSSGLPSVQKRPGSVHTRVVLIGDRNCLLKSFSANSHLLINHSRSGSDRPPSAAAGLPDLGPSPLGRVQPRHEFIGTKAELSSPTLGRHLLRPTPQFNRGSDTRARPAVGTTRGEGVRRRKAC